MGSLSKNPLKSTNRTQSLPEQSIILLKINPHFGGKKGYGLLRNQSSSRMKMHITPKVINPESKPHRAIGIPHSKVPPRMWVQTNQKGPNSNIVHPTLYSRGY